MNPQEVLPITMEQLTAEWEKWVNDKDLQSRFRFGQWVLDKHLAPKASWAFVYHADTETAWRALRNWIVRVGQATQPRYQFH